MNDERLLHVAQQIDWAQTLRSQPQLALAIEAALADCRHSAARFAHWLHTAPIPLTATLAAVATELLVDAHHPRPRTAHRAARRLLARDPAPPATAAHALQAEPLAAAAAAAAGSAAERADLAQPHSTSHHSALTVTTEDTIQQHRANHDRAALTAAAQGTSPPSSIKYAADPLHGIYYTVEEDLRDWHSVPWSQRRPWLPPRPGQVLPAEVVPLRRAVRFVANEEDKHQHEQRQLSLLVHHLSSYGAYAAPFRQSLTGGLSLQPTSFQLKPDTQDSSAARTAEHQLGSNEALHPRSQQAAKFQPTDLNSLAMAVDAGQYRGQLPQFWSDLQHVLEHGGKDAGLAAEELQAKAEAMRAKALVLWEAMELVVVVAVAASTSEDPTTDDRGPPGTPALAAASAATPMIQAAASPLLRAAVQASASPPTSTAALPADSGALAAGDSPNSDVDTMEDGAEPGLPLTEERLQLWRSLTQAYRIKRMTQRRLCEDYGLGLEFLSKQPEAMAECVRRGPPLRLGSTSLLPELILPMAAMPYHAVGAASGELLAQGRRRHWLQFLRRRRRRRLLRLDTLCKSNLLAVQCERLVRLWRERLLLEQLQRTPVIAVPGDEEVAVETADALLAVFQNRLTEDAAPNAGPLPLLSAEDNVEGEEMSSFLQAEARGDFGWPQTAPSSDSEEAGEQGDGEEDLAASAWPPARLSGENHDGSSASEEATRPATAAAMPTADNNVKTEPPSMTAKENGARLHIGVSKPDDVRLPSRGPAPNLSDDRITTASLTSLQASRCLQQAVAVLAVHSGFFEVEGRALGLLGRAAEMFCAKVCRASRHCQDVHGRGITEAQAVASVLREQVRGGMGKLQTYWQQRVVGHAERIVELEQGLAMERAKVEEERARQAAQPIRSSVPVTQTSSQLKSFDVDGTSGAFDADFDANMMDGQGPDILAELPVTTMAASFQPIATDQDLVLDDNADILFLD